MRRFKSAKKFCVHTGPDRHEVVSIMTAYGGKIQVHSFGSWYDGEIISVGRTRATVRYTTGGSTRNKAFPFAYLAAPGSYPTGTRIDLFLADAQDVGGTDLHQHYPDGATQVFPSK
jgi:hypothetical protein